MKEQQKGTTEWR